MATTAPPLVLAPIPVVRPWGGGRARELFGFTPPRGSSERGAVGEWWLASARATRPSTIRGGPHDGSTLVELLKRDPDELVGRRHVAAWSRRFPLLLKVVDTASPLSIQVHPSDADVADEGKTETWFVVAADAGASLWLGLEEGRTPSEVIEMARRGKSPESLLRRSAARAGTIAHLPPGTIHALGAGVVALEFQTSADTTYRIWDWGRVPPRPLHLDDALRVARANAGALLPAPQPARSLEPPREELVACDAYSVAQMTLAAPAHLATNGERFELLLALHSSIRVAGPHGAADAPRGHAVLVPAETSDFVVSPEARTVVLRFVPNAPREAPPDAPRGASR